jgi:hypothetical protein
MALRNFMWEQGFLLFSTADGMQTSLTPFEISFHRDKEEILNALDHHATQLAKHALRGVAYDRNTYRQVLETTIEDYKQAWLRGDRELPRVPWARIVDVDDEDEPNPTNPYPNGPPEAGRQPAARRGQGATTPVAGRQLAAIRGQGATTPVAGRQLAAQVNFQGVRVRGQDQDEYQGEYQDQGEYQAAAEANRDRGRKMEIIKKFMALVRDINALGMQENADGTLTGSYSSRLFGWASPSVIKWLSIQTVAWWFQVPVGIMESLLHASMEFAKQFTNTNAQQQRTILANDQSPGDKGKLLAVFDQFLLKLLLGGIQNAVTLFASSSQLGMIASLPVWMLFNATVYTIIDDAMVRRGIKYTREAGMKTIGSAIGEGRNMIFGDKDTTTRGRGLADKKEIMMQVGREIKTWKSLPKTDLQFMSPAHEKIYLRQVETALTKQMQNLMHMKQSHDSSTTMTMADKEAERVGALAGSMLNNAWITARAIGGTADGSYRDIFTREGRETRRMQTENQKIFDREDVIRSPAFRMQTREAAEWARKQEKEPPFDMYNFQGRPVTEVPAQKVLWNEIRERAKYEWLNSAVGQVELRQYGNELQTEIPLPRYTESKKSWTSTKREQNDDKNKRLKFNYDRDVREEKEAYLKSISSERVTALMPPAARTARKRGR